MADAPVDAAVLTCPVCEQTAPTAIQIGSIAICRTCGASLIVDEHVSPRRATAADLEGLSAAAFATLRKMRGTIAPRAKPGP